MHRHSGVRAHVRLALLSGIMGFGALNASLPARATAGDLHSALRLDIPAQDLGSALSTFAIQADVQILFTPETVAGLRSNAVSGTYSPEQALKLLLSDRRLEYVVTGPDSILVRRVATQSEAAPTRVNAAAAPTRVAQPGRSGITAPISEEQIIVTAQKRSQSLEDVPLSIAVVDGERIARQVIRNLEELSKTVPNIKVAPGGQADQLQIRGVGSGFNPGFEQAVATFVDGLYRGRSRAMRAGLFDLERVEVLKGPQSTFFGNNAIAGALNITSKKPGNLFDANVSALYGADDGEYNFEGGVSIPATDTLSLRVAGKVSGMDGYLDNQLTGDEGPNLDDKFGRLTFVWTPSDWFDATLRSEYGDLNDQGAFGYEVLNCPPDPQFGPPRGGCARYITTAGGVQNVDDDLNGKNAVGPNFFSDEYSETGLTLNAKVGGHTLTSVSGFFHHDWLAAQLTQGIPSPSPFNPNAPWQAFNGYEKLNQLSQELRLTSSTGNFIDYMAGVYYQRGRINYQSYGGFYNNDFGGGPGLAPFFQSGDLVSTHTTWVQEDETKSVFAAATVNFAAAARLNLGVRYSDVDKTLSRVGEIGKSSTGFPGPDTFSPVAPQGQTLMAARLGSNLAPLINLQHSDSKVMPSASVQYDFTDTATGYVSYTDGFKAGGFSFNATVPGDNGEFQEETVDAYEIGMKASWFDKRLSTNVAVFHMRYSGLQETTGVILPNTANFGFVVSNVSASTSQGVELSLLWQPTSRLRFGSDLAYLESEYDNFSSAPCTALQNLQTPTNCTQDLSGRTRAFAPKYSGTLSGAYQMPVSATLRLDFGANVYYTDDYFIQANLDPYLAQDAYTLVGARVGLGSMNGTWEVALIGKNLTDEIYSVWRQGINAAPGSAIAITDRPRSVGLQGRYRW